MKVKKVIALFSMVALLGTTGAVVFATENLETNIPRERPQMTNEQKVEMQVKMEERLSQALAEGKITQEEYDEMLSGSLEGKMYGLKGRGFKGEKPNFTDEQKAEMQVKMEERLSQALAEGKITQEEYDKILDGSLKGKMHKFNGLEEGKTKEFDGKRFKGKKPNLND